MPFIGIYNRCLNDIIVFLFFKTLVFSVCFKFERK